MTDQEQDTDGAESSTDPYRLSSNAELMGQRINTATLDRWLHEHGYRAEEDE